MTVLYKTLGIVSLGLGVVGAFVPLLPTTVFLLIAAWAFARSSERWHRYLLDHPKFGPVIRAWRAHRALPRRAKRAALLALAVSAAVTAWALGPLSWAAMVGGLCVAGVAAYIVRLPVLTTQQEEEARHEARGSRLI
jgi:uncharacterized membrane protein YbaN (DUF454 family)